MNPKVFFQVTLVEVVKFHVWQILVGVDDCTAACAFVQQHRRQWNVAVWIIKRVVAVDAAVLQVFNHKNEHLIIGECGQQFALPAEIGQDCSVV